MKPTSVIFLILAAVLIVGGIVLCFIAGGLAAGADIELFCDYVDENGNAVTEHDIAGKSVSSINMDLDNAVVNIIGGAEKSYIKVENFPDKAYEFWLTAGEINFKETDALSIFTSFRINESGFGFDGLRHYLALNKYKDKDSVINIYLAATENITDINVSVDNGEVNVSSLDVVSAIDITVGDGKVTLNNVNSEGKANIVGENAILSFDSCNIADTIADVNQSGTINCTLAIQHIFTLNCASSGNVYLDSVKANAQFTGVYPEEPIVLPVQDTPETGEADTNTPADAEVVTPVSFKGDVEHGDIKISVISFEY